MDCLKYAHTHGALWDADTCAAAAHPRTDLPSHRIVCKADERRCALDFLTYLHEEGCPWNAATLIRAMQCGNYLCLHYAFQQECPNTFVWQGDLCVLKLEVGSNSIMCKIVRVHINSAANAVGVGGEKVIAVNGCDRDARSSQVMVGGSVNKKKKTRKTFSKRQRRERRRQQARLRRRRAKC